MHGGVWGYANVGKDGDSAGELLLEIKKGFKDVVRFGGEDGGEGGGGAFVVREEEGG